ncbi:MAG: alkaline phosphatase family protein [Polyangiaceae bacterium]|jgi:phosphatidylinositol-3-phosphatase
MRVPVSVTFLAGSAIFASSGLLACGNGDDTSSPAPTPSDAAADGTVKDGATTDGTAEGSTAADVGTGDAGDAGSSVSALKHVYTIMMENHAQAQIIGDTTDAPNLNALAKKYGVATNYYGVTHPSLPNYLAAVSGDFQGIFDDCQAGPTVTCEVEEFIPNSGDGTANQLMTAQQAANAATIPHWFSGRNIVDQLEEHGLTWAAYMGDLIATGDITNGAPVVATADGGTEELNLYAQKHDPFMYFEDVRTNLNRMQKIVPYTNFATDIAGSTMPNYVWISPDQCSDMHGINADTAAYADAGFCTGTAAGNDMSASVIQYGDAFVGALVTKIMASPTWSAGSAIVIIFDEDDYVGTAGCCGSPTGVDGGTLGGALVPAIVISSLNPNPNTSADPYNHYSLLATLQTIWGLGCTANTCGMAGSQLMTKLFMP